MYEIYLGGLAAMGGRINTDTNHYDTEVIFRNKVGIYIDLGLRVHKPKAKRADCERLNSFPPFLKN